jgi:hypothetical protein
MMTVRSKWMHAITLLALASVAHAGNGSCDAVYRAGIKAVQTPHHLYTRTTARDGMVVTGESVAPGDSFQYRKTNGRWTRSPSSDKDNLEMAQERLRSDQGTCMPLGEQTVDGQAVVAYTVHANQGHTESQVRIEKSSGLLQGQTLTLPNGSVLVTRYDYTDVKAPADAN